MIFVSGWLRGSKLGPASRLSLSEVMPTLIHLRQWHYRNSNISYTHDLPLIFVPPAMLVPTSTETGSAGKRPSGDRLGFTGRSVVGGHRGHKAHPYRSGETEGGKRMRGHRAGTRPAPTGPLRGKAAGGAGRGARDSM